MKKMILGLALCLGLSQVVVAQKEETRGLSEDTNAAIAWIKNNPKKSMAIGAAIAATLTYGITAGVEIYKADGTKGKLARAKAGALEAAKDLSVYPAKFVWGQTVAGKDKAWKHIKEHKLAYGIPAGVVAVIAAAVIADIATTDKESELRLTQLWNKLFKKAATEEVVA